MNGQQKTDSELDFPLFSYGYWKSMMVGSSNCSHG